MYGSCMKQNMILGGRKTTRGVQKCPFAKYGSRPYPRENAQLILRENSPASFRKGALETAGWAVVEVGGVENTLMSREH